MVNLITEDYTLDDKQALVNVLKSGINHELICKSQCRSCAYKQACTDLHKIMTLIEISLLTNK